MPHEIDKRPMPGGGVNKPSSGTYGEKAEVQRLQQSLPSAEGGGPAGGQQAPPLNPEPINPTPPGQAGRPAGAQPPPGISPVLLQPTDRPGEPVATPPGQAPGAVTDIQTRLAVLDTLANHPDASAETREWAQLMIGVLLGRED